MSSVVDQPSNVILGHLGQLFLEYTFQASQDDHALPLIVVIYHAKLDLALALFFNRWLPVRSALNPQTLDFIELAFSGNGTTRGFATISASGVGEEETESLIFLVGLAPSGSSVALRLLSA